MSGIQQNFAYGRSFGPPFGWPVANIGAAYGGGFFAGQINVSGTKYNLVVAPKATGESSSKAWGPYGTTDITSVINGPTNSASLAALGASYEAATFCEGLTIGGYSDWYMPAKNELEVLYYFLKPTTQVNDTAFGSNDNAVNPPEPVSTNYTSGSPAQTTATGTNGFRTGEANSFESSIYFTSTEVGYYNVWAQLFGGVNNGNQGFEGKDASPSVYVRAVRRVPV